jgi:hypothetical protein
VAHRREASEARHREALSGGSVQEDRRHSGPSLATWRCVTPGFKGQSRVRLICAPRKNITYNDKVYRDKCHKYHKCHYYITKVLQENK